MPAKADDPQQDFRFKVSTGFEYSTGEYGDTDGKTEILYIPVTGKVYWQDWTVKITVPYLRITGPGNVLPEIGAVGSPGVARVTEEGLGDIVLGASWSALDLDAGGTSLDFTGKVKFPTADEEKDLGTGAASYYAQLDLSQSLGGVTLLGMAGYKFNEDTADYQLRDVAYGSAGAELDFADLLTFGGDYYYREAACGTCEPHSEATAYVSSGLGDGVRVEFYGVKGFSDGSPDWSAGATLAKRF